MHSFQMSIVAMAEVHHSEYKGAVYVAMRRLLCWLAAEVDKQMFKDPLQTCSNAYKKPMLGTNFYIISPSLKNPESMNMQVLVISMVFLLGTRCLLLL